MENIFEGCVTVGQRLGEGVGTRYNNVRNPESKMKTFQTPKQDDNPLSFFPLTGTVDTQRRGRVER